MLLDWIKQKAFLFRWRDVTRRWPVDRFLPTTDLDLSEDQRAELETIHSWRQLIPWYMQRFKSIAPGSQIYCFGVAHGSTVVGLVEGTRNRKLDLPHMHLFDSFEGLPEEDEGMSRPPIWKVGAFAAPREKLEGHLRALELAREDCTIHEGWFSDTLQTRLVDDGTFRPAAYVDIDADLYNSTYQVLDFLFANGLIRAGTLIGNDDWGDTELWTAGESRAHKEICAKYGARCAQLFSWGEAPLIRKLFLVVSVDG